MYTFYRVVHCLLNECDTSKMRLATREACSSLVSRATPGFVTLHKKIVGGSGIYNIMCGVARIETYPGRGASQKIAWRSRYQRLRSMAQMLEVKCIAVPFSHIKVNKKAYM